MSSIRFSCHSLCFVRSQWAMVMLFFLAASYSRPSSLSFCRPSSAISSKQQDTASAWASSTQCCRIAWHIIDKAAVAVDVVVVASVRLWMHFHSPHQGRNLVPSCTPRYQLYARHGRPLPKCGRGAAGQLRYLMRVELFMSSKQKSEFLSLLVTAFRSLHNRSNFGSNPAILSPSTGSY